MMSGVLTVLAVIVLISGSTMALGIPHYFCSSKQASSSVPRCSLRMETRLNEYCPASRNALNTACGLTGLYGSANQICKDMKLHHQNTCSGLPEFAWVDQGHQNANLGAGFDTAYSSVGNGLCNGPATTHGIRVYEGNGDNEGTTTQRTDKCAEACFSKRTALAYGPWSDRPLAVGFGVVESTGRCYCNHEAFASCTKISTNYKAYEFAASPTPALTPTSSNPEDPYYINMTNMDAISEATQQAMQQYFKIDSRTVYPYSVDLLPSNMETAGGADYIYRTYTLSFIKWNMKDGYGSAGDPRSTYAVTQFKPVPGSTSAVCTRKYGWAYGEYPQNSNTAFVMTYMKVACSDDPDDNTKKWASHRVLVRCFKLIDTARNINSCFRVGDTSVCGTIASSMTEEHNADCPKELFVTL